MVLQMARSGGAVAPPDRPGPKLGLCVGDEADGVADGLEVLDLFVRDAHAELLFSVDDDRHHRDGVDVQVLGEGLVHFDSLGGQASFFVDDFSQAGQDLFVASHWWLLFLFSPWTAGVPASSGGNDSNRGFGLLCDLKTGKDWE